MSTPTQIMSLADHLARTGQPVEAETSPALCWTPFASYGFAREFLSVPVVLAELHQTACAMPILFASHGGALYPAALLRLQDEADTRLITETGDWSGIYVPGLLRAHPFACALAPDFRILRDPGSPCFGPSTAAPRRAFDGTGAPTPDFTRLQAFLQAWHLSLRQTLRAGAAIAKAALLRPAQSLPAFADPCFAPYRVVDPAALSRLGQARKVALLDTGAMELLHAHLTSLETVPHLRRLARALRAGPRQAGAQRPSPDGLGGFLDAMTLAYEQDSATSPYSTSEGS